ncbi:hypothetical protein BBJ28_00014227 [Nothophytophthora sp. Chile5]|nr:hypothetical protein BBJ28_00014227 [Nothophytophthora sp. Chile5]
MTIADLIADVNSQFEAQLAEDSRPPFTSVQGLRDFIKSVEPPASLNVTLRMLVMEIVETPKNFRIKLIDEEAHGLQQTETLFRTIAMLDSTRASRIVFTLTLWKPRGGSAAMKYRVGCCYTFFKVRALRLYFEAAQGSAQMQYHANPPAARSIATRQGGSAAGQSPPTDSAAQSAGPRDVHHELISGTDSGDVLSETKDTPVSTTNGIIGLSENEDGIDRCSSARKRWAADSENGEANGEIVCEAPVISAEVGIAGLREAKSAGKAHVVVRPSKKRSRSSTTSGH